MVKFLGFPTQLVGCAKSVLGSGLVVQPVITSDDTFHVTGLTVSAAHEQNGGNTLGSDADIGTASLFGEYRSGGGEIPGFRGGIHGTFLRIKRKVEHRIDLIVGGVGNHSHNGVACLRKIGRTFKGCPCEGGIDACHTCHETCKMCHDITAFGDHTC